MKKYLNFHLIIDKLKMFSLQLISHLLGRFKLISDYYWALSPEKRYRFRLAAYAFAILAIGFIGGRITTVHRLVKVEQPDKEVAVDKSGAMSLTMPGVVLNADIYRFEKSTLQTVPQELKVPGRLIFNAEKGKLLSSRVAGRVERIYAYEGAPVKIGTPIVELYSPEFSSAQQEFLLTYRAVRMLSESSSITNLLADAKITQEAALNRLRNLGFAESDIQALEKTGKTPPNLTLRSPINGVVVNRQVESGAIVSSGDPLVFLADPKSLWFAGSIFEQDARYIERGQPMRIHFEAYPDKEIIATVNYIAPTVDKETRGLLIRADINNDDGSLRPDMYANAKLQIGTTQAIVVPQSAIVRDKDIRYAFIRTGADSYRRLLVRGFDLDGKRFAITEGIEPNLEILVSGAVLLNERFAKKEK